MSGGNDKNERFKSMKREKRADERTTKWNNIKKSGERRTNKTGEFNVLYNRGVQESVIISCGFWIKCTCR